MSYKYAKIVHVQQFLKPFLSFHQLLTQTSIWKLVIIISISRRCWWMFQMQEKVDIQWENYRKTCFAIFPLNISPFFQLKYSQKSPGNADYDHQFSDWNSGGKLKKASKMLYMRNFCVFVWHMHIIFLIIIFYSPSLS